MASLGHNSVESAYIHVPFCRHRCAYCNFTVVAGRSDLEQAYLDALEIELSWLKTPRPVKTLFVGGGTPTELSPHGLRRLCGLLDRWHPRLPDHEVTFEANPDSLDQVCVDVLAAHGVNRLSMGVQSFSPSKLKLLDRRHTTEDVTRALDFGSAGFRHGVIGFDLCRTRRIAVDLARRLGHGNGQSRESSLHVWTNDRAGHAVLESPPQRPFE